MPNFIQRAYPRKALQTPIRYMVSDSSQFRSTRTINFSMGGLCFETDQKLAPETEVCVVMDNYAPGISGPERYRSYLTRVRWNQPHSVPSKDIFFAGTQIMACSHDVFISSGEEPCHICDLCGAVMQECLIECTEENAQLCGPCHRHYRTIPEGQISKCVERFLIGNVV